MSYKQTFLLILSLQLFSILGCKESVNIDQPNVVFVITDDQGYGDLACHGNPWIKTPKMDNLYDESIRFINYHCGTTCSPSRAGIMTGKDANHVNAWHTILGREHLRKEEYTLANAFSENGYSTGLFGKWHLGDNYPYRPFDRGFQETLWHKGGGVGQAADFWNNDYFDDTYFRNDIPEKFEGYCTDVWFSEAINFIKKNKGKPFFCYISTNAPHGPFRAPQKYVQMYDSIPGVPNASFYGMISNIDENLMVLDQKLEEWGLKDNTIFIFTTDNGSSAGTQLNKFGLAAKGYNSGMRGKKSSKYDGGHRVPFFIRWPIQNWEKGRDINTVASYTDVFPTLVDWCNLSIPDSIEFDGISWSSYLEGQEDKSRVIFADTQREKELVKWKDCAVITNKWRLIDGKELYDMEVDPGQQYNVAENYSVIVEELKREYESWWNKVSVNSHEPPEIIVDFKKEYPCDLSCQSLIFEGRLLWLQNQVRQLFPADGHWMLNFVDEKEYEFRLYRWPAESNLALNAEAPEGDVDEAGQLYSQGKAFNVKKAWIKIAGTEKEIVLTGNETYASFRIKVPPGSQQLEARLIDENGVQRSAYYVSIL